MILMSDQLRLHLYLSQCKQCTDVTDLMVNCNRSSVNMALKALKSAFHLLVSYKYLKFHITIASIVYHHFSPEVSTSNL